MEKRGGVRTRKGNHYAVARYGRGKQLELRLPNARDEDDALERSRIIAEAIDSFMRIGRRDLVDRWARELASANDTKLPKVQLAIAKIVSGEKSVAITGDILFRELSRRYTEGELAKSYPDHIRAKDYDDDKSRLRLYILPLAGDVPVRAFTMNHANRVMQSLPPMASSNRRHVAQIMHRLLKLAVFPLQLREHSPLPAGWLPKINKKERLHYSCLFPKEEARLLGYAEASEAFRLFCGVLDREGMRLSELLDCEWSHWGDDCRTFLATKTKTDDPRMWAVREDTARAMRIWREKKGTEMPPFAYLAAMDRTKIAALFRDTLKAAGVTRAELFATTKHTAKLRAHDMRATFVTLSLAEGKTDTWIRDRTGHKSTAMIDRYRRHARQLAELNVGSLVDLVEALGWIEDERRHTMTASDFARWMTTGEGGPEVQGAGSMLGEPPKTGPSESTQPVDSTEGGTRTLTSRGRRILNTAPGAEEPPEELKTRWIDTSRDVSRRASSTLPAPLSRPAEHPAADSQQNSTKSLIGFAERVLGIELTPDQRASLQARDNASATIDIDGREVFVAEELSDVGAVFVGGAPPIEPRLAKAAPREEARARKRGAR